MRGRIVQWDAVQGRGTIQGDDGSRYAFGSEDLTSPGLVEGMDVAFEPAGDRALRIVAFATPAAAPAGGFWAPSTEPAATAEPRLSLWGYFLECMRKYLDARGRARRREYWGFTLFYLLFLVAAIILLSIVFFDEIRAAAETPGVTPLPFDVLLVVLFVVFIVVMAWPGQRHDNRFGPDPKAGEVR
jgi:uncharacterized membrane protein YhaH (DUF805 family)